MNTQGRELSGPSPAATETILWQMTRAFGQGPREGFSSRPSYSSVSGGKLYNPRCGPQEWKYRRARFFHRVSGASLALLQHRYQLSVKSVRYPIHTATSNTPVGHACSKRSPSCRRRSFMSRRGRMRSNDTSSAGMRRDETRRATRRALEAVRIGSDLIAFYPQEIRWPQPYVILLDLASGIPKHLDLQTAK